MASHHDVPAQVRTSPSSGKHFLSGKTIIIAGGGVAGSAFAASLQSLWHQNRATASSLPPSLIIYDRDQEDIHKQREGYSLSLTANEGTGGLLALQRVGLVNQVVGAAVSGLEGKGCFKLWGPDWSEQVAFRQPIPEGLPASNVRIARKELRRVLHESCKLGCGVRWNRRCVATARLPNGRLGVKVVRGMPEQEGPDDEAIDIGEDDGDVEMVECDLLVAADGAHSELRQALRPEEILKYSGAVLRGGLSRFDNNSIPKPLDEDWGFAVSGTGVTCFCSPVDANSLVWTVGNLESKRIPRLDLEDEQQVEDLISQARELGKMFHEPFSTVVDHTDRSTVMCINAEDKLPFSHSAKQLSDAPIVFIGDANHALSPFAGVGANLALWDGYDLARCLVNGGDDQSCSVDNDNGGNLLRAVEAYDAVSVPRATKVVENARKKLMLGHSTGWKYWLFWLIMLTARMVRRVLGRP